MQVGEVRKSLFYLMYNLRGLYSFKSDMENDSDDTYVHLKANDPVYINDSSDSDAPEPVRMYG